MKKIFSGCVLVLTAVFFFSNAWAAKTARVDVLYMNHGPLMDTLARMKGVFAGYGDRISVSWYDFDSKAGEDFKAAKGINQHVPLMIWIDGSTEVRLGPQQISFVGFPTGAGPEFFQGRWTFDDLKKALDEATAGK